MELRHVLRLRKPWSPAWSRSRCAGAFPSPPAEEEEVDEEMDNEGSEVPGSGVGNFMTPSRKQVMKSPSMKRASLRVTETRSSVLAKAGKLSAQDPVRLCEQCSALAKGT